jgi:uncharacterized membrane protein YebE (DUF533 family)
MFDANQILGVLMESGMGKSGQSRAQRLAGGGQSGGLADIAGALLGGGSPGGGGGIADIAGALLGGGGNAGRGGGMVDIAGALLGGGGGRNVASTSAGAMGMLGTLATLAMQHFGSAQGGAAPGLAEEATPYRTDEADPGRATVMIRAMITAAKADGEIDPQERQRILGRLEDAGAGEDAQAFVRDELAKPVDVAAIVAAVDSPHAAVEVYAASLFAIDVDTPAEDAYMRQLAASLRLDPVLVRSLHQSLEPAA